MPLSWNEIRVRAAAFASDWKDAHYEKGETHSFYNDFFQVFGRRRRDVAIYEEKVNKLDNRHGYIDLFWPGYLLVEQKSAGRDLTAARDQATDYFLALSENEKPRYILLSDFQTFELLDLDENTEHRFRLSELPDQVRLFDFVAGYQQQKYQDQDPVNVEASELMSNLHRQLEDSGYEGNNLERLLVRLMFCLFADDTGIFQPDAFLRYVEDKTREDGNDLGSHLIHLFETLDTPLEKRQTTLDEDLAAFPYVNGALFQDPIRTPSFDTPMREALLKCCYFNWSRVSPALFGSLFQTVMLPEEQRQGGAHYTSERNILKTIHPLFLDQLRDEFRRLNVDRSTQRRARLERFHAQLANLTFFDPACGCGNFLILAYRELRQLEIEILEALYPADARQTVLDVGELSKIDVDQFYGIEIEEFPVRIAEAAMWLVDHQMNMKLSEAFGHAFVRLPLRKSAQIHHGNALELDWSEVITAQQCKYILGNPPFVGSKFMDAKQREELMAVFSKTNGAGVLDYVSAWFGKAAQYIQGTTIKCALVSTNSITQGEQVGVLWNVLLNQYGIKIHFAHRTFKWTIDERRAKGMRVAAVYVVIIGFATFDTDGKYLFEYETLTADPHQAKVGNINPYLVDGPNVVVQKRSKPLCDVPPIGIGNKPIDNGNYLFTPEEKAAFIAEEPLSAPFFRLWVGATEFLYNEERWCLWLGECPPEILRSMPLALKRVEAVRKYRLASKSKPTQNIANKPTRFHVENIPESTFLVIPKVTSERREYVPIGFMNPQTLASDLVFVVSNAEKFHFGVLTSQMHMAWMRYVCGRLEGRYRYSNLLVYNNYPWPTATEKQRQDISEKAQAVLDARAEFPNSTLADLYDPDAMPASLRRAHDVLDRIVDRTYSRRAFPSDKERVAHLFELYQKLTEPMIANLPKARSRRRRVMVSE